MVSALALAMALALMASAVAQGWMSLKRDDLWAILVLLAFVGALAGGSERPVAVRAVLAASPVLALASVNVGDPVVQVVLLQLAFLTCSLASVQGREREDVLLPVGVTAVSTLFILLGVLFEAIFRLRMDDLAMGKASVAATVVGYALRLGLPPMHLWQSRAAPEGSTGLYFSALRTATLGLASSFLRDSVAWAVTEQSLRDLLVVLGLASAALGFLLSLAREGRARMDMVALGMWALPVAGLAQPVSHREALAMGLAATALLTGWALTLACRDQLIAIVALPVYPTLLGAAGVALTLGLVSLSAPLALLALITYGIYSLSISRPSPVAESPRPLCTVLASGLMVLGGLALGWLLMWAGTL